MRKFGIFLIIMLLCLGLCACGEAAQPTTTQTVAPTVAPPASDAPTAPPTTAIPTTAPAAPTTAPTTPPTTAAPTAPTEPAPTQAPAAPMAQPEKRPAHAWGSFDDVIGWYLFTYQEGSMYPAQVTATDLQGQTTAIYTFEWDENGRPTAMILCDASLTPTGDVSQLSCDDRGYITQVQILSDDGSVGNYTLTYSEDGRMISTAMEMMGKLEIHYDERYFVTQLVITEGENQTITEFSYADDGRLLQKYRFAADGSLLQGLENCYDDSGLLCEQLEYANGSLVRRTVYQPDGSRTAEEYDSAGNMVVQESFNAEGASVQKSVLAYHPDGQKAIEYLYKGDLLTRYRGWDTHGRMVMNILYNDDGSVLRYYRCENTYYDDGALHTQTEYNEKGQALFLSERNADGSLAKEVLYSADGIYLQYTFSYSGEVTTQVCHNGEGRLLFTVETTTASNGQDIGKATVYNCIGTKVLEEDFEAKGLRAFYRAYFGQDADGFYWAYQPEIDVITDDGILVVITMIDSGMCYTSELDENGQLICDRTYDDNGELISEKFREN